MKMVGFRAIAESIFRNHSGDSTVYSPHTALRASCSSSVGKGRLGSKNPNKDFFVLCKYSVMGFKKLTLNTSEKNHPDQI